MSKKLSKKKQAVWDRLNHVPQTKFRNHFTNFDINSMYPQQINTVLNFTKTTVEKENVKFKVLKSR